MLSQESHQIRLWLLQNMKNASPPSSIQEARDGLKMLASRINLPAGTRVEPITARESINRVVLSFVKGKLGQRL